MDSTESLRITSIENEMKRCPDIKMVYLQTLKDWLRKQPHLPYIEEDLLLLQFLRRCSPSIEKAKVKLDNYLTLRTYLPDLNDSRETFHPDIKDTLQIWHQVILPRREQHGHVVFIAKMLSPDVAKFHPTAILKVFLCYMECYIKENGTIPGYVAVIDANMAGVAHLSKCTLTLCKQIHYFVTKCCPVPIKGVYVVNGTSFEENALKIFKALVQNRMMNQVQILPRGATERLHEYLPREILPKEYGGDAGSIEDLHRATFDYIKRGSRYIATLDKQKVCDEKRRGVKLEFGYVFGVEGSFTKLEVD